MRDASGRCASTHIGTGREAGPEELSVRGYIGAATQAQSKVAVPLRASSVCETGTRDLKIHP